MISENEYKGVKHLDRKFSESFKRGGECDWEMYEKEIGFPETYEILLQNITRKIITENWELVLKIANKLVEKKKIKSEEVKQLLGDWGLKEKQHPYILELERIPQEAIKKE